MNNLIKSLGLLIILSMSIANTYAQSSDQTMLIKGLSTESEIRLRMMPDNEEIWDDAIQYGYRLERVTLGEGDKTYTLGDQDKTKKTLIENYKPNPAQQFPKTKRGEVAKAILYDNMPAQLSGNNNLADAMAYQENVESKYLFSMILAEQDYDIALAQALAYTDVEVKVDHHYLYLITIERELDTLISSYILTHSGALDLPIPKDVSGYGGHLSANLDWNLRETNEYYNMFNIERSKTGEQFRKVNNAPFSFISDLEENPEKAYYMDDLPENNTTFFYRVVGVTPFGINSQPSKIIEVSGVPEKLNIALSIDSLYEKNEGKLTIDWKSFTHEYDDYLDRFDVYMRLTHDGDEVKMNSSNIPGSKRKIQLEDVPADAYYRLEATDKNGHTYSTLPKPGRINDATPPEAPVEFTGKILKDGTVLLSWEENTEPDLEGYKVFYSNASEGEYVQTQPYIFKENEHRTEIDVNVETDLIFYKVAAFDTRLNRSVFSEVLELERPDNVAPSKPHIAQVITKPDQIRLSFKYSGATDVETYTLERKVVESTIWTTLAEYSADELPDQLPLVEGENFASHFIDLDSLELRYYHYRLIAEDKQGNKSSSILQKVMPYDDMIRGTITDLELLIRSEEQLSLAAQIGGVYNGNGEQMTELKEVDLGLLWEYDTQYDFNLREFKIYMQELPEDVDENSTAADHHSFTLIRTISAELAESTGLAMGNGKYGFMHTLSKVNSKKYVFKVISYHNDGGTSEFSALQTFPQ